MDGTIFSIEEFSIYDGPGIRTSVFMKGCPLRCTWCHNPEGQERTPEIMRSPNGCVNCGACLKTSERVGDRIVFGEESVENCPMHLIRMCGERVSSLELSKRLLKNKNILNDGGGVTFSGGEPTMQSDFLKECLLLLSGKLHTAIQTCGYCKTDIFAEILKVTDYVLFDLKILNDDKHKEYTGVSNKIILENFERVIKSGKPFQVRVPLIPTVTDTEENLGNIARLLKKNNISYLELLSYNKMAGAKYSAIGRKYNPCFDETIRVNVGEDIFSRYGIKIKVL